MENQKENDNIIAIDKTFTNNEGKGDYAKWRAKGSSGFRTRSLFADVLGDMALDGAKEAPFWLSRNHKDDGRPVMREHYIMSGDPTGYQTAIKFLGCYEHWEAMVDRCPWFREALAKWKVELQTRQKAAAVQKILDIALSDSSQSLAAAKYIATMDYEKTLDRGRPSKAEIKGELKRQVKLLEDDADDAARIGVEIK